ncbi:Glycosyltransferase involved in cell wall bisynthesis [Caloramator fervidus]|uniref:Glycosyltransferase involved in cell wall bisynthesis n=1 Tax=Caloramator fervidus TaxID=29344 RepID=A0A1H5WK04_9CLOT|nr:glycosyltransferase [Caloramator fervidus]SEF99616.1 Glycosyltransferase involved in cell wall bisynthesis [Caloramator fervidus]
MKLSICIMTKNSERYIKQCLESIKPIINVIDSEIVVVDTGSTDNTVEIVKSYTDKIYSHYWNDDFSEIKNLLIRYASGEWLLFIDSDEIIENPEELISFFELGKSSMYNSATIKIKNYLFKDNEEIFVLSTVLRLFRKDKDFYFKGSIHEQPKFKQPVYSLNLYLKHYGYIKNDKKLMEYKFRRNVKLLEKELLNRESDKVYIYYQLSVSYTMYGRYEKALYYAQKAYEESIKNKIDLGNRMYVYLSLIKLYYINQKYLEAKNIAEKALKKNDKYIDIYYVLANINKALCNYNEAINNYLTYLDLLKLYKENKIDVINDPSVNHETVTYEKMAIVDLCSLYYKINDYDKVIEFYKKLDDINLASNIFYEFIFSFMQKNKINDLKSYYDLNILSIDSTELATRFEVALEKYLEHKGEEFKTDFIYQFSNGVSSYSLLNKVRVKILNNEFVLDNSIIESLKHIDINRLPNFYGDIIYYILKSKVNLLQIFHAIKEDNLLLYLEYCKDKYDDFNKLVLEYLKDIDSYEDLTEIRILKTMEKFLLLFGDLTNIDYRFILERYLVDGIRYITRVYSQEVINNELIDDVKDNEHAFLIYIYHAINNKGVNIKISIAYLKKALNIYPLMKIVVEYLLEDFQKILDGEKKASNDELEKLKKTFKDNINLLLEAGKISEVIILINEYLKIIPNDIEMLTLKSDLQIRF